MSIKKRLRLNALKHGYRSGLEDQVRLSLQAKKCSAKYECLKIEWEDLTYRLYTPDFLLPNGIIVETKGRFTPQDRKKHLCIKEQHPNLDIRFVFSNSKAKIRKGSKTSYAMWCEKHKFLYADKDVPAEWIKEKKKLKKYMPTAFIKFPLKKLRV